MSPPKLSWVLLLGIAASSCQSNTVLPPFGEVLLIVDTDAAVPMLVGRLRVDAYTEKGTWYASRDFLLENGAEWPTSFGVYSADPSAGGVVTVRLRGYADGNVRDYLGERYQARPVGGPPSQIVPTPSPPPGHAPRLLAADGSDATPAKEPEPLVAIDRLVLLRVTPGVVKSARVALRGACFGTMADVATSRTCLDTENELAAVTEATLGTDLSLPAKSLQGSFGAPTPCRASPRRPHVGPDGTPLYDEEVCVGGGTFIFGNYPDLWPERIVTTVPFLLDKYEVTVGRYRDALSRGMSRGRSPLPNDAPIPTNAALIAFANQSNTSFCTYSDVPRGRETLPVSCISWSDARYFCQFGGGDLPSEIQFEWVASAAGRPYKTFYPWGGPDLEDVPCSRGAFARGYVNEATLGKCVSLGLGPAPVDQSDHPGGDVSVAFHIVGLAYSMEEWLVDSFDELDTRCWMDQPILATTCDDPRNGVRTIRGGAWASNDYAGAYTDRSGAPPLDYATGLGFRCARKATP